MMNIYSRRSSTLGLVASLFSFWSRKVRELAALFLFLFL
ncbi:unnamed protein product [Amoebophrya sp. A120]|nr:unnamed protein product [Amoebophrya sp. A120]|eukprot:GSA120T00002736001.1